MAIEERADPTAVQVIRRLVMEGDRKAVPEYIRNLPSSDLKDATAWFAKSGRTLLRDDTVYRSGGNMTMENLYANLSIRDVVTVMASSPRNAARLLPWSSLTSSRNQAVLLLVDAMVAKGEDWCREFVAAAIVRNAKAGRETAAAVIRHCLPLILHFKIPATDLEAYPRLWAFYYGALRHVHEVWDEEAARTYVYPSWGGLQFRIGPAGCCEVLPRTQTQLLDLFDLDGTAPDALMRCLYIPDALAPLRGSGVGAVLCSYLRRGTLDRADVLERVERALSRCDGTPKHRLLAEVLTAVKPTPEETAGILPLLLSVVATSAGFLSFLALGLLLAAPLSGSDLQELSSAVFARSEKKPQILLVRHLKSLQAAGRDDDGALQMCWQAAAGSADLKIRSLAESVVGAPAPVIRYDRLSVQSLWASGTVEQPRIPPYVVPEVNTERPLPFWDRQSQHTVAEEQYLDRFLRATFHAPREVRDWYARRHPLRDDYFEGPQPRLPDQLAYPDPETVVKLWASGGWDLAGHKLLTAKVLAAVSGPFDAFDWFCRLNALAVIRVCRYSELAVHAGTVAYSLATPSHSDFRVDLQRLVPVLNVYAKEGWTYGEADFFQALLRLGPMDRELASEIPEIPVGPTSGSDDLERQAGRILRDWVAGGGFAQPAVGEAVVLPVSLDRFPSLSRGLLSPEMWKGGKEWQRGGWLAAATVVPFWPDLGAVWHHERAIYENLVCRRKGELAGATAGGLGLLTHEWLVTQLAATDPKDAVDTVLELARRGLLHSDQLAQAARNQLNAGGLAIGRLTRNLALVAYEGHLDRVWAALAALVEAAVARPRLPAGTDGLLATCTELWAAIPRAQRTPENVPAEFVAAVLQVAGAKTGTKSTLEAKRLAAEMGIKA
ncbi:MAG: hypothetical protein ACTHL6_04845 [Arthrobacter sp.]